MLGDRYGMLFLAELFRPCRRYCIELELRHLQDYVALFFFMVDSFSKCFVDLDDCAEGTPESSTEMSFRAYNDMSVPYHPSPVPHID